MCFGKNRIFVKLSQAFIARPSETWVCLKLPRTLTARLYENWISVELSHVCPMTLDKIDIELSHSFPTCCD